MKERQDHMFACHPRFTCSNAPSIMGRFGGASLARAFLHTVGSEGRRQRDVHVAPVCRQCTWGQTPRLAPSSSFLNLTAGRGNDRGSAVLPQVQQAPTEVMA